MCVCARALKAHEQMNVLQRIIYKRELVMNSLAEPDSHTFHARVWLRETEWMKQSMKMWQNLVRFHQFSSESPLPSTRNTELTSSRFTKSKIDV